MCVQMLEAGQNALQRQLDSGLEQAAQQLTCLSGMHKIDKKNRQVSRVSIAGLGGFGGHCQCWLDRIKQNCSATLMVLKICGEL